MHPIYFYNNYDAILHQDIVQPFEQIKRKVFFASEKFKNDTTINLYDKRIIYIQTIKDCKIIRFNQQNTVATFGINDIFCKIDIEYLDDISCKIVAIGFYCRSQVRLIRNSYSFFQAPIAIGNIDKITYSEAIRTIQIIVG